LCGFISEAIYDGRLEAHPSTAERYLVVQQGAHVALRPAGLSFVPVAHDGCMQSSRAEAETILKLITEACKQSVVREGKTAPVTLKDILIVAPYNLQVNLLRQLLPDGAQVGTVDKFQGQEAAIVIVSMTTSKGTEAPRGTEFLFNPNRFNVAISRAECLAIVVHSAELLEGSWTKIDDLRRLNLFAHAEAIALQNEAKA
jgi:superfamily I DNA and/or RNA helicase